MYFINTTKPKTILSIKEEISEALGGEVSPLKMRIYPTQTAKVPLPDVAALADHENLIKNDQAVLYVVFRKPGQEDADGEDQFGLIDDVWEDVAIIEPK
jgi:hypothetical protein